MYFPSCSASLGGKSAASRMRQKSDILRAKIDAFIGQGLLVSGVSDLQSRHEADEQVATKVLVDAICSCARQVTGVAKTAFWDHRVAWFKASSILAASRQASIPPCLRNWSAMTFMP